MFFAVKYNSDYQVNVMGHVPYVGLATNSLATVMTHLYVFFLKKKKKKGRNISHAPYTLAKSSSLAYNSLTYSNPNNFAFKVKARAYILEVLQGLMVGMYDKLKKGYALTNA
jgi:hypothetical protein